MFITCDNDRVKGIELFSGGEFRWQDKKLLGERFVDLKRLFGRT